MTAQPRPNLFVVGTAKAGTTFLCRMLAKHREVYVTKPKEPFFFNRPALTEDDFAAYLEKYFNREKIKPWKTVFAEGSTPYFQSRAALDQMPKFLGLDFKAIVVMRQPVAKCLSYYMHHFTRGRFDASRSLLDPSIVRTAMYAEYVGRWMGALGRERFLPMKYDALQESPADFVNAALGFAGVAPLAAVPNLDINPGFEMVRRGEFLEPVTRDPARVGEAYPRFPLADVIELQKRFDEDIRQTQALTGLDLSRWLELPDFASTAGA